MAMAGSDWQRGSAILLREEGRIRYRYRHDDTLRQIVHKRAAYSPLELVTVPTPIVAVHAVRLRSPHSSVGWMARQCVLADTNAPTSVTLPLTDGQQCWNFLLSMMSSPGTYSVTFVIDTETSPWPTMSLTSCRLDRTT
jgi:hypothetical protein